MKWYGAFPRHWVTINETHILVSIFKLIWSSFTAHCTLHKLDSATIAMVSVIPCCCDGYSMLFSQGTSHSRSSQMQPLLRWLFDAVAEQLKLRRRPYTVTPCEQPISSLSISNETFALNCPFALTDIMYQQTYVCLFLLQFIFYSTSLSTIVTLCEQPISSLSCAISNALQLLRIYLMLDFRIFHRMSVKVSVQLSPYPTILFVLLFYMGFPILLICIASAYMYVNV